MEIQGKIIAILPIQQGTSKSGNTWSKQEYVVETTDKYPKKMCFGAWNDKIEELAIQMGEELKIFFDVDAREWQGRWFNEMRAWKAERAPQAADNATDSRMSEKASNPSKEAVSTHIGPDDDLPF